MTKLTVALMVYNEEKYLEQTLNSILDQGFEDMEILVGNNASTDKSSEIIESFAKLDSRINHIKRESNIGALQNWNNLVERANGEYFVMAGGHDKWSPEYLHKLCKALDNNPHAVLAFAKTTWIDKNDQYIEKATGFVDTSGLSVIGKFVSLLFSNQHYLMGMMKTKKLRQTRTNLEIIGSGEIFLQELVQLGDFILVENERWYRRIPRKRENSIDKLLRYKNALFSNKRMQRRFGLFPHMQMMMVYLMLPVRLKNLSIKGRILLLSTYPLIIAKFISRIRIDLIWFFKSQDT